MLHARRQRIRKAAEVEAAGSSLWTDRFDTHARERLLAIFTAVASHIGNRNAYASRLDSLLRREIGVGLGRNPRWDFEVAVTFRAGDDDLLPSVVEGLVLLLGPAATTVFEKAVNVILYEHRIAFELIKGQMIEIESKELHAEVVAPTLRLLAGRTGWEAVEAAYQEALSEIADGKAEDAITMRAVPFKRRSRSSAAKGTPSALWPSRPGPRDCSRRTTSSSPTQ